MRGIRFSKVTSLVAITTIIFLIVISFPILPLTENVKAESFSSRILITDDNTNNTADSMTPRIAIDTFDNIHIVWLDWSNLNNSGTDADIYYKKFNSTTKTWNQRILITDDNTNNTGESWHPVIAVDPMGNIHIVWDDTSDLNASGTDRDIYYRRWDIGTTKWASRILITDDNANNTGESGYPWVASDQLGNIHVVWNDYSDLNNSGIDADVFYKRWDFITKTWGPRILITDDNINNTQYSFPPKIATDYLNNVHIVWDDLSDLDGSGSDVDIFYRKWNFTTKSWEKRVLITDDNSNNTEMSWYPVIATGINNNVHIAWIESTDLDGSGPDVDVFYRKWDNVTLSWAPRVLITNDNINNTGDSLCWGISTDKLGNPHIVWYDNSNLDNSGFDWDVYYKNGDDVTSNWGSRILITSDNVNNTMGSYHPSIAISSSNTVHIVWDEESDLDGSGSDMDIYYVRSNFPPPIDPPTNLSAELTGANLENVTISWDASLDDPVNVSNYALFYSTNYDSNGSNYGFLTEVPASGASRYYFIVPGIGEGDPYNYFFYVQANTTVGFSSAKNDTQVAKFTRNLATGRQLISIPLILNNTNISNVLRTLDYEITWYYNNTDVLDPWKSYNPSKQFNDLVSISRTMGLWVNVLEDSNLTITGIVPKTTDISLKDGWNLIGYPSFIERNITEALSGVDYSRIEGYCDIAPENLRIYQEDDLMVPSYGYWVKVDSDTILTITN